MEPSNRHSKKDAKQQKMIKKQQLAVSFTRKEAEQQLRNLQDDKSQSQFQDPIIKRAMKWWQRIDEKYFKSINIQQVLNWRDICTSNQVVGLGSSQPITILNYKEQMINSLSSIALDKNKIRVLFKSKFPYIGILVTYGVQNAIPHYSSETIQSLQCCGVKLTSKFKNKDLIDQAQHQKFMSSYDIKHIRLDLQESEDNQVLCQRVLKMSELQQDYKLDQIDKQISLWQWELQRANQQNTFNWNNLIKILKQNPKSMKIQEINQYDNQIGIYKDKISWGTVLRSFQHGFKDKTQKMFNSYIQNEKLFNSRPPKGLPGTHQKKFFQTDCKICFCSDNNQSNQVLYCDSCNTSFHLACYGLSAVPQEDQYFCQRCAYNKRQQTLTGIKTKKLICQICYKSNFPMKKIGEHFYHVTCLILFNFVQFHESKMILRGSLTHENIMKMVIENQLQHEQCSYCKKLGGGTQLGMQIKCTYTGCQCSYHPICAYLHGCKFQIKATKNKTLDLKMFCNNHLGSRTQQVYMRRYMCNLNETSSKTLQQFKAIFESEQQALVNINQNLTKNRKKFPNRILMMTKLIKNTLKAQQQKKQQEIQTQTQKILKALKNKAS